MRFSWWYAVYALMGAVFLAAVAFKVFQPVQVLPRVRLAPGFQMLDHRGEWVSNEDLRGRIVLFTFWYSSCPEPCYDILPTMEYVARRIPEIPEMQLGDIPVAFVVISLDPLQDSPEVLAPYAQRLEATTGQTWYFLTHPDPQVLKTYVGAGFQVYYQHQADGSIRFDPRYVLVDGWGIVRGEYKYETVISTRDRLVRHFGVLAREIRNSQGAARVAYEAAHLFLCYAP